MLRFARIVLWIVLVSSLGCARSAVPLGVETGIMIGGAGEAGRAAESEPVNAEPMSAEPEQGCTPCGEHLSASKSLRCLCRSARCPTDLDRALSDLTAFAAYAKGCRHAWFVARMGQGYDLFVFQRNSGELVYAQHTDGDASVTCEDGTQSLLLEGGRVPVCEEQDMVWCRFAHVNYPIGIGELDRVKVCGERALR
jgi:hypothetical protein